MCVNPDSGGLQPSHHGLSTRLNPKSRVSEAVNALVRLGLLAEASPTPFVQPTRRLGFRIAVTNVAEAIDLLGDC